MKILVKISLKMEEKLLLYRFSGEKNPFLLTLFCYIDVLK